jgi:hypothetical protein
MCKYRHSIKASAYDVLKKFQANGKAVALLNEEPGFCFSPVATFSKVHTTHLRLFSLPAPYLFTPFNLRCGILKRTDRVQVSEAVLGSIGI